VSGELSVYEAFVRSFDTATKIATVVMPGPYGMEPIEAAPFTRNGAPLTSLDTLTSGDRVVVVMHNNNVPEWVSTYTDWPATANALYVNTTGDTMTGALTLSGPPSSALHAATKAYVDGSVFVPDVYQATSQAQMLALPATKGDYCIRNDVAKTFILQAAPPTVLANWIELATPDASAAAAAAVAAHVALADPHTQYLTKTLAASTYTTVTTYNAHVAAADPHPGYTTPTEVTAQIATDIATHVAAGDPHPVYTTGTELTAAFTAHTSQADPHPVYATDGDLSLHVSAADAHPQYLSESEMDAAILAHVQAPDPHPTYMTQTESDLLYRNASYLNTGTLNNALLANPITSNTTGTAAAWTTARTFTLAGNVTGSASVKGDANVSLTATVVNDSHTHNTQYYDKATSDARYVDVTGDVITSGLLSFGSRLGQHLGLNSTTFGIGAQTNNTYFRTASGFRFYLGGVHSDTAGAPGAGGIELLNITTSSVQFKARNLATEMYVQARGMNLVANGSGLTGDNTNFSTFNYNSVESFAGGGSFTYNGPDANREIDEFIPVDPSRRYKYSYAIKLLSFSQAGETPNHYGLVDSYDTDGLSIQSYHVMKLPGSALTTLAVALAPGATTITLTSAVGWHNGASTASKYIAFYPYTNAQGYTYPFYTYTRNVTAADMWASGAISGNVITLRTPWAGSSYAIGTPVANAIAGGTYDYIAGSNVATPTVWTVFSGSIGKLDSETFTDPSITPVPASTGAYQSPSGFRWGTAFVKVGWLLSYNTPVGTANTAVDAVTFETISTGSDSMTFTGSPPFAVTSTTLVPNLNADMVDGLHAAAFLQLTPGGTVVGNLVVNPGTLSFGSNLGQRLNLYGTTFGIGAQTNAEYFRTPSDFYWYSGGVHSDTQGAAGAGGTSLMSLSSSVFKYKTYDVWHKGNMGSGSTLDADLLDNHDSIYFANRTEMEALLGDLMFVGVYDAAKYVESNLATWPQPIWTGGTSTYRHGMYWVAGSSKELNFIDADYSGRYDAAQTYTVSNRALTSNVATLTTSAPHAIVVGKEVLVEGVDPLFDGKFIAKAPLTSTTFSYDKTNANVSSTATTAGTATLTFDAAVPVNSGDWIIALDPNRSANVAAGNYQTNLTLSQVVFQYIPFSTETYVKSVMELHTDPLRSPDPHSQYLLPAEADITYAQIIHTHEFDINQSLIKHMGFDPWAVTGYSWANGVVTLTVNPDHNLLAGAHFDLVGVHVELNGNQLVQEVDALTRVVRFEHAMPTGYTVPVTLAFAGSVTNDPHAQYLVENEGNALYAFKTHPHNYEVAGAVAFHEGKPDPHPQYLTDADALVQYAKIDHLHDDRYSLLTHVHPIVNEIHSTDGANSADIYIGANQPAAPRIGDLWIDTVTIALQKPSAIVNFTAAQATTPPQMKLTWTASPATEAVTSITVSRSTAQAGPWTSVYTGVPVTTVTDNSGLLVENTNYYYRIYATNLPGDGAQTVIGPVLSGNIIPTLPTGVAASVQGPGAVRLTWTPVAGLSYEVFLNGVSQGIKTTPFDATLLPENTDYVIGVRAIDAPPVPNQPGYSVVAYATKVTTPNVAPPVITGLVASNTNYQGFDLTWNYPTINDLQDFHVSTVPVVAYFTPLDVGGNGCQVNGLDALTNYTVSVAARDTAGVLGPAQSIIVATIAADGTTLPPNVALTGGTTQTNGFKPEGVYGKMWARFTVPSGVTAWRLDRSTNGVNWTLDTNWANTGTPGDRSVILNAGTAYASGTTVYCRVYTRNAANHVNYTDFPPYTLIATPTLISADGTNHWRNINGGQWNGSGNLRPFQGYYDASYPNAKGCWFYGTQINTKLYYSGRRTVTSCKMWFRREACGLATGAVPIIQMHNIATNPGTVTGGYGDPALTGTSTPMGIAVTPGGAALQGTIPAAFITDLLIGTAAKGIAVYDSDGDPYMCFSTISEFPTSGQLSFDHLG
jgi:hypothetical protein